MPEEVEIGRVLDYFARIGAAGIALSAPLRVGDRIHIKGHTSDFEQAVESIELEREAVQEAQAGQKIGIKVAERCRAGDHVYKATEPAI